MRPRSPVVPAVVALVLALSGSAPAALAAGKKPPKKPAQKIEPPAKASEPRLAVVAVTGTPEADYEAEVYASVPLGDPYARERGLDQGLVTLVLTQRRALTYRVARDRIRKVVRLVTEIAPARPSAFAVAAPASLFAPASFRAAPAAVAPRDHLDVLDTEDGVVLVDTITGNLGIFTRSDVYVLPKGASLAARLQAIDVVASPTRERLRRALALADAATPLR